VFLFCRFQPLGRISYTRITYVLVARPSPEPPSPYPPPSRHAPLRPQHQGDRAINVLIDRRTFGSLANEIVFVRLAGFIFDRVRFEYPCVSGRLLSDFPFFVLVPNTVDEFNTPDRREPTSVRSLSRLLPNTRPSYGGRNAFGTHGKQKAGQAKYKRGSKNVRTSVVISLTSFYFRKYSLYARPVYL